MDTIVNRLKKIAMLAKRGVAGEQENAVRMLDDLLHQHGLTLEDVLDSGSEKKEYTISYKTRWEKRLLFQIYGKVTGKNAVDFRRQRGATKLMFTLTATQHIDFMMMYDAYRPALEEEMKTLFTAFLSKHDIFPPHNDCEKGSGNSRYSPEELKRIFQMSAGLRDVAVLDGSRMIEGGADKI